MYIQTFQPDAAAIAAAAKGDYATFAAGELEDRRAAYFPPYCRLSTLVFRSKVEPLARDWAALYAQALEGWAKKAMMNTFCAGKFSSDRTIKEYVDDIWHLDPAEE